MKNINNNLSNVKIFILALMLYSPIIAAFKGQKECDAALKNKDFIEAFKAFNQINNIHIKKDYETRIRTVFNISENMSLNAYLDSFNAMQQKTIDAFTNPDDDGLSQSSRTLSNNEDALQDNEVINRLSAALELLQDEYNDTLRLLEQERKEHLDYQNRKEQEIRSLKKHIDLITKQSSNKQDEPKHNNSYAQNLQDQLSTCKEEYNELQKAFNSVTKEKFKQDQEIQNLINMYEAE